MKDIVLASASPRRQELLRQIGITFTVEPSNIDESIGNTGSAEELVQDLAYRKAASVAERLNRDALVIGADTVVYRGCILGKPEDEAEAFKMLKALQGEWHEVITGIAVIDCMSGKTRRSFEKTKVKMREMPDSLIEAYISTGEPKDKAGAYGIQGMGALLVERIEGCYFNVVGLPLLRLTRVLEGFGISVL